MRSGQLGQRQGHDDQFSDHFSGPARRGPTAEVPVACSLTPANLAAQAERWHRLAARAMSGRTATADGLHISFRAEPGVDTELRQLAAIENDCCGWAAWAVTASPGQVALNIRSSGEGIAALHAMFSDL